jgi:AraC-like DNA-binding protein
MATDARPQQPGPIIFSTLELAPRDRLAAWNAAFGRLNEITVPDPAATALVHGTHWDLGGMVVSQNRLTAARFRRCSLRARRDGLDHWVVRVLRRGECRLRHDGFTAVLSPGQPLLFSMHDTWLCEWSDADWVSVTLPRELHPELSRRLAGRAPGPLSGPAAGLLATTLVALPEQLAKARPAELAGLGSGLLGLLSGCLASETKADDSFARRQRARDAIQRRMASARLTPKSLAAELGLSRSALYRLFEAEGGVAREIQAIRLAHARDALRDATRRLESVAAIGAAHGFPDPAVFSRSFRRAFGMPPGAARGAGPGEAPPSHVTAISGDLHGRLYARRTPTTG